MTISTLSRTMPFLVLLRRVLYVESTYGYLWFSRLDERHCGDSRITCRDIVNSVNDERSVTTTFLETSLGNGWSRRSLAKADLAMPRVRCRARVELTRARHRNITGQIPDAEGSTPIFPPTGTQPLDVILKNNHGYGTDYTRSRIHRLHTNSTSSSLPLAPCFWPSFSHSCVHCLGSIYSLVHLFVAQSAPDDVRLVCLAQSRSG